MNDPQVIALIYAVEHGNSVSYETARPLCYSESPEFDLTVEDKVARFELRKFYADVDEAREAIEPFIQRWEFDAALRGGPNSFSLRFGEAEIVDRNPSPPELRSRGFGASAVLLELTASASGSVVLCFPHYPSPPARDTLDPDDDYVVKTKRRYDKYRLGRTTLPDVAYFCVTVLEDRYGDLRVASKAWGISKSVLKEVKALSSYKGGENSRKADGFDVEFSREEKRFLDSALREIIIRAAQVAADGRQCHLQITKADLLNR